LIGSRFGRLTVTDAAPSSGGKRRWVCSCDCGNVATTFAWKLLAGRSRSCGCLKIEQLNTRQGHELHGMRNSPEYALWTRLKSICYNPRVREFWKYGALGVQLAPEWKHSFSAFYRDVGPRPSPFHKLLRYNDDGNFAPGNCRWVLVRRMKTKKDTDRTFLGPPYE
jgi:hypothetical protein